MIKIEPAWHELLDSLHRHPEWRSTLVVGPSDSGKSTLCRFLGAELARDYRTARIDCDPGQSVIGPPACLGLGWEPWRDREPEALRFIGSKTPARHFMQMLTGVKRLSERAEEIGVERVIFDPPGYMDTDAGREFMFQMIDLIQPELVVALQRQEEMEPLLGPFVRRIEPTIHRLAISDAVVKRDPPRRISYRKARFANYLAGASEHRLDMEHIGFHGRIPRLDEPEQYRNRLVGLCDKSGFVRSVGIVEAVDRDDRTISLYCPVFDPNEVASIDFGSLYLDRSGEEI